MVSRKNRIIWSVLYCIFSVILSGCTKDSPLVVDKVSGPVEVGFRMSPYSIETRSIVNPDGNSVIWESSDVISLWAKSADNSFFLAGQPFSVYGLSGGKAVFTSMLPSPMPEGEYTYYASSPAPVSADGTNLTFILPAVQDGRASSGTDIMLAGPVTAPELRASGNVEDYSALALRMKHLVHLLKFYYPNETASMAGEKVLMLKLSMPWNAACALTSDLEDPLHAVTTAGGSALIQIPLAEPLGQSDPSSPDFAFVSVAPSGVLADPSVMTVEMYTDNHIGVMSVNMAGRDLLSGHATRVPLVPSSFKTYRKLNFKIAGNNLGEDIKRVVISAPVGMSLGVGCTNVMTFDNGSAIPLGSVFSAKFDEAADFLALAGQTLDVEFESDHAVCHSSVTVPAYADVESADVNLTVPYLFAEDFASTTVSYEYNSNRSTGSSNSGSNDAVDLSAATYGWPAGWTGARCGIKAGDAVRICARSEKAVGFPGNYNGRIDSPALSALKDGASVRLRVQFDYAFGWNGNKTSGPAYYLAVGTHDQDGPVDALSGVGSWISNPLIRHDIDDEMVIDDDITTPTVRITDGSYPDCEKHFDMESTQLCTNQNRIVWEVYLKTSCANSSYFNNWVFIDNIKISIAQ